MVIGTVAGAATIVATVIAAPVVATAVAAGAGSAATATAVGASAAAVATGGATATAAATGVVASVAAGATETMIAFAAPLTSAGPWGWITLGAEDIDDSSETSWDCWKQVVREENWEKSRGRLLCDLAVDPRLKEIFFEDSGVDGVPNIILVNQWSEKFQVQFVIVNDGQLAGHVVAC